MEIKGQRLVTLIPCGDKRTANGITFKPAATKEVYARTKGCPGEILHINARAAANRNYKTPKALARRYLAQGVLVTLLFTLPLSFFQSGIFDGAAPVLTANQTTDEIIETGQTLPITVEPAQQHMADHSVKLETGTPTATSLWAVQPHLILDEDNIDIPPEITKTLEQAAKPQTNLVISANQANTPNPPSTPTILEEALLQITTEYRLDIPSYKEILTQTLNANIRYQQAIP